MLPKRAPKLRDDDLDRAQSLIAALQKALSPLET